MLTRLRTAQKRLDRLEGTARLSRNRTARIGDTFDTWDDLRARMTEAWSADSEGSAPGTELIIGLAESLLAGTER